MGISAAGIKRLVVKVGTSTLTYPSGQLNLRRSETLIRVLSDLANRDMEVLLVSSGAIAVGMGKLGFLERPKDVPGLQACAAVGQCELMYYYDKHFGEYNRTIAQILLTSQDLLGEESCHVVNTLERLLQSKIMPIINENDTVSVSEILHGDNDTLSAQVARLIKADGLVLLTDIDGFYDRDPRLGVGARLLPFVNIQDEGLNGSVNGAGSSRGTGGMRTKLEAARVAVPAGVRTFVLNGADPEILYDLLDGSAVGSEFVEGNRERY